MSGKRIGVGGKQVQQHCKGWVLFGGHHLVGLGTGALEMGMAALELEVQINPSGGTQANRRISTTGRFDDERV